MSKKKIKKVVDVGFIPGIYNYCDRWCEKCEQQLRCMSFVMGKKIEEKGGFNFEREGHREDESIWARLKEVFESTYEVLHELAEERGLDVEDIYASENIDREFWGEDYEGTPREQVYQKLESSDLLRICSIYEYWAVKCLEQLYEIINDKENCHTPASAAGNRLRYYSRYPFRHRACRRGLQVYVIVYLGPYTPWFPQLEMDSPRTARTEALLCV